jgi:hypothetical protein
MIRGRSENIWLPRLKVPAYPSTGSKQPVKKNVSLTPKIPTKKKTCQVWAPSQTYCTGVLDRWRGAWSPSRRRGRMWVGRCRVMWGVARGEGRSRYWGIIWGFWLVRRKRLCSRRGRRWRCRRYSNLRRRKRIIKLSSPSPTNKPPALAQAATPPSKPHTTKTTTSP